MSNRKQRLQMEGPVSYGSVIQQPKSFGDIGENDVFEEQVTCWGTMLKGLSFFAQSRQLVSFVGSLLDASGDTHYKNF